MLLPPAPVRSLTCPEGAGGDFVHLPPGNFPDQAGVLETTHIEKNWEPPP
jgi:hypothetical protein